MFGTNPLFNRLIFVLSVIGALVAGFLWYLHATHGDIPCGASNGCEMVAESRYARFPEATGWWVAGWGTLGYIGLAALSVLRTFAGAVKHDRLFAGAVKRDRLLLLLLVGGSIFAALFSLRLTYLELVVINAICKWCITSQVIILAIAALSIVEWLAVNRARKITP